MVESWLISATEYIANDNILLRPGGRVDGGGGGLVEMFASTSGGVVSS